MPRGKVLTSLILAIGIIAAAAPTRADADAERRTRTVSGRILQVGSMAPVSSVQVLVRGERIGTMTAPNGRFELPEVPEGSTELLLRHPCYFVVQVVLPEAGDAEIALGLPFDESSLRRAGCGGLDARSPD